MAGLREKKKEETLRSIIENANKLIQQLGFAQMTMQQLAADVGIGVGTLYNYFPSKSDLLLGILHHANLTELHQVHEVLLDPSKDVATKLELIMGEFVGQITLLPRVIMKEVIRTMVGEDREQSVLANHILQLDVQFTTQLEAMLEAEKQAGLRDASFDSNTAVQLFYDLTRGEIQMYFLGSEVGRDELVDKIKKYVRFLFANKV